MEGVWSVIMEKPLKMQFTCHIWTFFPSSQFFGSLFTNPFLSIFFNCWRLGRYYGKIKITAIGRLEWTVRSLLKGHFLIGSLLGAFFANVANKNCMKKN